MLLFAAGFLCLAVVSWSIASSLVAFEPCRVLYRAHQPVQDSLACQVHEAIGLSAMITAFFALALGVAAATLRIKVNRGAKPNDAR